MKDWKYNAIRPTDPTTTLGAQPVKERWKPEGRCRYPSKSKWSVFCSFLSTSYKVPSVYQSAPITRSYMILVTMTKPTTTTKNPALCRMRITNLMKTVTSPACFLHACIERNFNIGERQFQLLHTCSAHVTSVLICSADSRSTNHLIKIHQTLKLSRKPKFENLCRFVSVITSAFVKISPNYSSWEVQMQDYLMIHLRFLTLLKREQVEHLPMLTPDIRPKQQIFTDNDNAHDSALQRFHLFLPTVIRECCNVNN